ncbi:MAG: enoyl-CoA hydratase/isomerase family protein [Bacteriovoracaceae bacterium]|nr:enoyl-CoA hydratase/isomerase family protein [Bacteriovoracaceae bacterium]
MLPQTKWVSLKQEDGILFIGFGVNEQKSMVTLNTETLQELETIITYAKKESSHLEGLVFFSHKPHCFLAGMDIHVISALKNKEEAVQGAKQGQELFNQIADLSIPTMAMIQGVCLGGGLELALSCKIRIVSSDQSTRLGLPEVKLGILPGFGGTYRLPQKIGMLSAVDMILTGKMLDAKKAYKLGLAQAIIPAERFFSLANKYLIKTYPKPHAKIGQNFLFKKIILKQAKKQVLKTTQGHYPAPLKILELLSHCSSNRKNYLDKEANFFAELFMTSESKNLQHIFFLTDQAKKVSAKVFKDSIKRGGVLGAGTMGGGLCYLFAKEGQFPILRDINLSALELGLDHCSRLFSSDLKKKKIKEMDFYRRMFSVEPTLSLESMKGADLIIEAVVEDMDIKKKVFKEVEEQVSSATLITSNTSSLSISEMAGVLKFPERFAGLHFFNPVHKMPLVEIITHAKVSEDTIQKLYQWVLTVGKIPVIVKDAPGFLVNRILMPYINEAAYLLDEGYSVNDIDHAALNFGMPMGPCRLMDEIGFDVLMKVGKIMQKALGERATPSPLIAHLVAEGRMGKKNKKGFYNYPHESIFFIPKNPKKTKEDLTLRLILPMLNEAARVLEEGIVAQASSVDLALIYAIGFPPFRGGIFKFADQIGLNILYNQQNEYTKNVSASRYAPCTLLQEMTLKQQKFYP